MSLKIKVISEVKKWKIPGEFNPEGDSFLHYKGINNRDVLNTLKDVEFRGQLSIGKIESLNMLLDMSDKYIVGWEGITDEHGNTLKFETDLLKALPLEVQIKFTEDILLPVWQEIVSISGEKTDITSTEHKKQLEN